MKTITENAINEFIANVKNKINARSIDSVLNLPSQFRWYAAKNILSENDFEISKLAGIRKLPKDYNKVIVEIARNAVKRMAYKNADFGRYQSTHEGSNVLPENVRVRFSKGERYSKKYVSTDLYADYFFSVSDSNTFEYIIKTKKDEKQYKISFFDLEKYIYAFDSDRRKLDFIYNHPLFKKLNFEFDRKEIAVKWNGYEYHLNDAEVFNVQLSNKCTLAKIIKSFQNRKRIDKKNNVFNSLNLKEIVVTIQDSVKAGNCEIGTNNFANKYFKKELQANTPITGEMIISKANNDYTKRAILKAANI